MKKKSFLVVLLAFVVVMCAVACGKNTTLDEYKDFEGIDESAVMSVDEGMKIDGALDESVWTDSKNRLESVNGEKNMSVYTHLGENGVYFGFAVKDDSVFYNPSRIQTRNTGVEIYLSTLDRFGLEPGSVSLRLTPTGSGSEAVVSFYRPNIRGTEWLAAKVRGKYIGAAVVNGEMNAVGKAEGYSAEIAVAWELLGVESADAVHFTAAFIQTTNYNTVRDANTFISGTKHTEPLSWKAVTNDGFIEDKYAYMDRSVKCDDYMNVDGKLDEAGWTAAATGDKGKTFTHTGTGISLSMFTLMTDAGLYVGLDSNDDDVYYNPAGNVNRNTGAELLIAAKGTRSINSDNVVQLRFNVGGSGSRYVGNPYGNYPYKSAYFPALTAGSVKNGEINSSGNDGWTGEIFIPWASLGVESEADKEQIAMLASVYHSESVTGSGWQYIAVTYSDVYSDGSAGIDPQREFFNFTKDDGFVFNGIGVSDVNIGKNDLTDGRYEVVVTPAYTDAVKLPSVTTFRPAVSGGSFDAEGAEGVSFADNEDGSWTISVAEDNIAYFNVPRKMTFISADGESVSFNVLFDGNFQLDGILDDVVYQNIRPVATSSVSGGGSAVSEFKFAANDKGMYVGVNVTDALVNNAVDNGSGVEMYFNFGETLSSKNTYQIRLYVSGAAKYYVYADDAASDGWSWSENSGLVSQISTAASITADGYVLEAVVPWSLFGLDAAPESFSVVPLTKFYTNSDKTASTVLYDQKNLGNAGSREIGNYVNVDKEIGFDPLSLFADDVLIVQGAGIKNGNYSVNFTVSYAAGGALKAEGASFGDYDQYITELGDGRYNLALPVDIAEAITASESVAMSSGNASGTLKIKYTAASAEDFNSENVISYINFDDGLSSVDGLSASMRRGEAVYGTMPDSYASNRYYVASQRERAAQLDGADVSTGSFTVSMMLNVDELVSADPVNGYCYVLFGTSSVDLTTNGNQGVSIQMRHYTRGQGNADVFRIRALGSLDDGGTNAVFGAVRGNGWQRWTFVFDRSDTDMIVKVYIDAKLIYTSKAFDVAGDVSLDGGDGAVFGIGAPGMDDMTGGGSYPQISVGIDDFMLYDGAMSDTDICNMTQHIRQTNLSCAFFTDDILFDFQELEADGSFSRQFIVNKYLEDGSTVALSGDEAAFGAEIAEYITAGDGYYTFSVPAAKLADFKNGIESTYSVGGRVKPVRIVYTALEALYTDADSFEFMKSDADNGLYKFSVGIYADSGLSVPVPDSAGVTFGDWDEYARYEYGIYKFSVPASVMEALTGLKTVEVVLSGDASVPGVSFYVSYDSSFSLDGERGDEVYEGLSSATVVSTAGSGRAESDFMIALADKAVYISVEVKDALVNSDSYGSGVEMYFTFGDALSSANTFQIRLSAIGEPRFYGYIDNPDSSGWSWKQNTELQQLIVTANKLTLDGYAVEAAVPWSLFGRTGAESCKVALLTKYYTNEAKTASTVKLEQKDLGNWGSREIGNYVRFNKTAGFAPEALYTGEIGFLEGSIDSDGRYTADFTVSYLADGLLKADGVTFGSYGDRITGKGGGVYTLSLTAEEAAQIDGAVEIVLTEGTAEGSLKVTYVKASAENFDDGRVRSFINFDSGIGAAAGASPAMTYGSAAFADVDGSYISNKAYSANMLSRALKLENFTVGTGSFTVSAMFNGDDVKAYPDNTYAFVLFGTGNVDGNDGFSMRLRPSRFQLKIGSDTSTWTDNSVTSRFDGWQRWTFVFDRTSEEGKLTFTVYLDGEFVYSKTGALDKDLSLDVTGYNSLGIGAPGSKSDGVYKDSSIRIDDFMFYDGAMTQADVYNMVKYVEKVNSDRAFGMNDIAFDFGDLNNAGGYSAQFSVNKYLPDGSAEPLSGSDVAFGDEIKDFISFADGSFTIEIPAEDVGGFAGGIASSYTVGGITKSVNIVYTPLAQLYLDKQELTFLKKDKTEGYYNFSVGVYADEGLSVEVSANKGVTFGDWDVYIASSDGGAFNFSVPEAVMESLTEADINASVKDIASVGAASFKVVYIALSAEEITDIAGRTDAFIDFNGNIDNIAGGGLTAMRRSNALYDNGAYVASMRNRALGIENLTLGTGSFTVSMMINGDDVMAYPGNTYAFILFGTGNVDGTEGFTLRIRPNIFQLKIGADGNTWNAGSSVASMINGWQRWTFVFDRTTEKGQLIFSAYIDGKLAVTKKGALGEDVSWDISEYNRLGIGAAGSKDDGTKVNASAYLNYSIRLDDFVLMDGLLTERQIMALDSHFADILAKNSWSVSDVKFTDNDGGYTGKLKLKSLSQGTSVAGAEFTGLPDGVTINENDGVYTLSVPEDKFADFASPVRIGATVNEITKYFEISYTALNDTLYLSAASVDVYAADKKNGVYAFGIGAYADSAKTVPVTGVSFGALDAYAVYQDGIYSFSVPAAVLEASGSHTVSASKSFGSASASSSFTVNYVNWTADDFKADIVSLLTFDDATASSVPAALGAGASIRRGEGLYKTMSGSYEGDKYYVANQKERAAALSEEDAAVVGTGSFTVSAMYNFDELMTFSPGNGYSFILFGTSSIDGNNGFSLRLRYKNNEDLFAIKVLEPRDTAGANTVMAAIGAGWHRWTTVFDRSGSKLTVSIYIDGEFIYKADFTVEEGASLLGEAGYGLGIGAPAKDDMENGKSYPSVNVGIDDFMLINGTLSDGQVKNISRYIDAVKADL